MNNTPADKNRRVLVIDDNRSIYEDFCKILAPSTAMTADVTAQEAALFERPAAAIPQTRFEVDGAFQGQEGVLLVKKALADGRPYAMAFVDVRMPPGWDGVETTRRIWELDPNLQVVICTAYSDYSSDEMFEKLGRRDGLLILKKPFDPMEAFQMAQALTEKWWLHQESARKMEGLERRVAERTEELANSLSLLKATFESTGDGIVFINSQHKIISYNTKFASHWQFPDGMLARGDAGEMRAHVAGQVKDPALFLQRIKEIDLSPDSEVMDVMELKDGRIFERYAFAQRIDGERVGTVINWRDVTERRRAAEALNELSRKTERRERIMNSVLSAMSDFAQIYDRECRIVFVNQSLLNLWGLTLEAAVGRNFFELGYPAELVTKLEEQLRAVFETGQRITDETPYTSPSGARGIYEYIFSPIFAADNTVELVVGSTRDITERKRVEEELQWKTTFLEAQVNSTIEGILVVDQQGKKILQNSQFATLLKIPLSIADDPSDEKQLRWVADSTKNPDQFTEKVVYLNSHPSEISHDEIELKDGSVLDRYSSPVVGGGGKYYGRIWTFRDITERKRGEESVRLLGSAVEQAKESIVITDAQLGAPGPKIIFVNPAFTQMTGYTAAEVIGKTPRLLQGPRTDRALLNRLRQNLECGETFIGEAINYRKDGTEFDMEWQIAPLRDGTGKVTHFVAIQHDITQRKQAENASRESSEKFHQLADNITDAFWIRSPDLSEVHYLSPAFERIWGRTAESLYANPQAWPDFISPEDRERVVAAFAELKGETRSLDIEYRIVRPDGQNRWVRVRGFQVRDAADKLIRHTGIVTDVTERKQLEIQLFQSQKLETVGKLAGGVAHEFNNILTAIIGQSELLLADLPRDSALTHSATEINRAAVRAALLTRQLLAYGRKQFLRPETLDLSSVLVGMETTLRHLMGPAVDLEFVPGVGLKAVKADAGQIEQVIMNLAMNALDAMPNGGKLTLETANASLDKEYASRFHELKAGEYVMLAITDTGTGMSEEVKARVFEPFFTTKGVGEGTGLGLSTCYGILKQSGGHISVYSELSRGATFKIYLPQVAAPVKILLPRPDLPDLPRGTETILLVEDDPALREMAATLLTRLGYLVLVAANGVEALSLTHRRESGQIDLLFTDVVMPHMNGRELSDRIRALYPQTRILFTSAYTENAIIHQGVLNKGMTLLQKPFTPSALALKVRELLDQPSGAELYPMQKAFQFTQPAGEAGKPGS